MVEALPEIQFRHAELLDVPQIQRLVEPFVRQRVLLRRSEEEMGNLTRTGFVAEANEQLIGFAALEIYSRKLAELQCLAVAPEFRHLNIGRQLVGMCIQCAKDHQVVELMAITAAESFFQQCGFHYALPDQKKALFINTTERPDESF